MPKYPPNYLADVVAAVADLGRARAFGGAVRGEVCVVLAEGAPASRRDCGNINHHNKLSRSAEGTPAYPKPRPPHCLDLVEIPPKFVNFHYITKSCY